MKLSFIRMILIMLGLSLAHASLAAEFTVRENNTSRNPTENTTKKLPETLPDSQKEPLEPVEVYKKLDKKEKMFVFTLLKVVVTVVLVVFITVLLAILL